MENHAFFFFVARTAAAIADGQVLQLAFTGLVANRTIQRMVDQQKLHHTFLGLDGFVALGVYDHALRHRRRAGWHWFGRFFDIDQAHTAIGRDAELLVIAKMRNIGANLFGCMHHRAACTHFHFLTVEFDFNHGEFALIDVFGRRCYA